MEIIFFIGGLILGVVTTLLLKRRERIHGVIHVDHKTEQCVISLTSDQLMKKSNKIAVFMINHDAKISQE